MYSLDCSMKSFYFVEYYSQYKLQHEKYALLSITNIPRILIGGWKNNNYIISRVLSEYNGLQNERSQLHNTTSILIVYSIDARMFPEWNIQRGV